MDSFNFPLSAGSKKQILDLIFDVDVGCSLPSSTWDSRSYFCYYQRCVEKSSVTRIIKSHGQLSNLVRLLKTPGETRTSIKNFLRAQIHEDELNACERIMEESLNLAVRVFLMLPTGCFLATGRSITLSGETKLNWDDGTIQEFVRKEFSIQRNITVPVKLEKTFHAMNLERIAGVEVRWTSNLADHLRMRDDDKAVEIFHYATFLQLHSKSNVLPPELVQETLQTLSLLLPEHDRGVEKWFRNQEAKARKRQKLPIDTSARECGQLKTDQRQIDEFHYWHDRLVILKQVFDEAEPRTIKQWWCDRRRHVQWYTFWVAALVLVLTIVFGMIQCVEGGLQVWLAFKALK